MLGGRAEALPGRPAQPQLTTPHMACTPVYPCPLASISFPAVSGLKRYLGGLPSAVFQKSQPGRKWGVGDRAATYVKLGLEYSLGAWLLLAGQLFGQSVGIVVGAHLVCSHLRQAGPGAVVLS